MTATTSRGWIDDVAYTGARWGGWRAGGEQPDGAGWRPAVDVAEHHDAYVVTVEIPGLRVGDVEVTMADGTLTIQGARRAAREAVRPKVHRSERGQGSFQRLITLPSSYVKADEAKASARDGVLEILIPKAAEAQATTVRVRVSAGAAS